MQGGCLPVCTGLWMPACLQSAERELPMCLCQLALASNGWSWVGVCQSSVMLFASSYFAMHYSSFAVRPLLLAPFVCIIYICDLDYGAYRVRGGFAVIMPC
jgi:hypothetical protein